MDRWHNKIAIVTGASVGIGVAIARDLVKAGINVVGLARRVECIEVIAEELKNEKGKLYALKCDVSKEDEVKEAFKWTKSNLGGVDVLVNNAGIVTIGFLTEENNSEAIRSVLDINVWGLCICTREAVLSMRERNVAGHIININSIDGQKVPDFTELGHFTNVYPASKYAVTALTETLRQELIHLETRIKVTSISPGMTVSEIGDRLENPLPANLPILQAEDISAAVIYVLGTPEHVQVHELTIKPIGERM